MDNASFSGPSFTKMPKRIPAYDSRVYVEGRENSTYQIRFLGMRIPWDRSEHILDPTGLQTQFHIAPVEHVFSVMVTPKQAVSIAARRMMFPRSVGLVPQQLANKVLKSSNGG